MANYAALSVANRYIRIVVERINSPGAQPRSLTTATSSAHRSQHEKRINVALPVFRHAFNSGVNQCFIFRDLTNSKGGQASKGIARRYCG